MCPLSVLNVVNTELVRTSWSPKHCPNVAKRLLISLKSEIKACLSMKYSNHSIFGSRVKLINCSSSIINNVLNLSFCSVLSAELYSYTEEPEFALNRDYFEEDFKTHGNVN